MTDINPKPAALPVLAYVFDFDPLELSPFALSTAADGVCRLLWVLRENGPASARTTRGLRHLGEVVDVTGLSDSDAWQAIAAHHPRGVGCFTDPNIAWAAALAESLELPFHSTRTAALLTDKLKQRAALLAAGLPTPRFWQIDDADPAVLAQITAEHPFPAVIKPRVGSTSRNVARVDSADELLHHLGGARLPSMLLEEYIPDPSSPLGGKDNASYVSVELLASDGDLSVLGVTGRPPLAPPFRETGSIFPAELAPELRDDVVGAALAAARALEVRHGAMHVEVKLTDAGPVIIEVNGRPGGGGIPLLVKRALGVDILQSSLRIAVGDHIVLDTMAEPEDVGFLHAVQPPAELRRITAIDGLAELSSIEGIDQVVPNRRPGDEISWRDGSLGFVVVVTGAAADHDAERNIREKVFATVRVTGER